MQFGPNKGLVQKQSGFQYGFGQVLIDAGVLEELINACKIEERYKEMAERMVKVGDEILTSTYSIFVIEGQSEKLRERLVGDKIASIEQGEMRNEKERCTLTSTSPESYSYNYHIRIFTPAKTYKALTHCTSLVS
ncbi:unnamed protein product [Sphenostylis stenocarpa]|uniref:Uncharacterized protein n=1 Tax=Sphenostylis stenocarpa TaxID=92480 RepID=A0AA86SZI2_9FABA|nr:unnamed protein product [Sphenostylis stenocarpa]